MELATILSKTEKKEIINFRMTNIISKTGIDLAKERLGNISEETVEEMRDFKKTVGKSGQENRSLAQLKTDFIKNLDKSSYSSTEAFNNAKDRLNKMNDADFGKILLSIFA